MSENRPSAGDDGRADRGGPEPAPRPSRRGGAASRHGAIARELTKYANYKNWANKMRGSFAPDVDDPTGLNGTASGRR